MAGELRSSPANMASALEHPEIVSEYLAKECSEGRVLGPLDPREFPYIQTSRFGVIPKGSTNKWRLIVDLSSPEGASVNDGIDRQRTTLSYVGVKDAAEGIRSFNTGTLLAKLDVKRAYRNTPVHPEDWWLLGMLWDNALFLDTTLPLEHIGIHQYTRKTGGCWECSGTMPLPGHNITIRAYRNTPVHPEDRWLLGMLWDNASSWTQHYH